MYLLVGVLAGVSDGSSTLTLRFLLAGVLGVWGALRFFFEDARFGRPILLSGVSALTGLAAMS